jgi:hypothetical protein
MIHQGFDQVLIFLDMTFTGVLLLLIRVREHLTHAVVAEDVQDSLTGEYFAMSLNKALGAPCFRMKSINVLGISNSVAILKPSMIALSVPVCIYMNTGTKTMPRNTIISNRGSRKDSICCNGFIKSGNISSGEPGSEVMMHRVTRFSMILCGILNCIPDSVYIDPTKIWRKGLKIRILRKDRFMCLICYSRIWRNVICRTEGGMQNNVHVALVHILLKR